MLAATIVAGQATLEMWLVGLYLKGKAVENQSLGPYTRIQYTEWQQVNIK
jgi:hypothetical protein